MEPQPAEVPARTSGASQDRLPAVGQEVRTRAHVVTALILGSVVGFIWLVWSKPVLLLYLLLAIVGVMAYAAIYLLVSARMVDEESLEDGVPEEEPEDDEDS